MLVGATGAGATSTAYYVDSTAPCPGSGTQASPWCDFSVVNSTTFSAGDQVLLKRGDTFASELVLYGSGTSTSYVTIGAYGSGPGPTINGGGDTSFVGINLYNNSYVAVEDLQIDDAGVGILINDVTNQTGYRFQELYLSGDGEGIQAPASSNPGTASDILVQDVDGAQNTLSCQSNSCEGALLELGGTSHVIVNRVFSTGSCSASGWGLGPGASDVVVENSESTEDAACYAPQEGSTANFVDKDTNLTFVNDIISDVPPVGNVDRSAIDVEPQDGPNSGISIEDSYIADNAGPGIQINDQPSPTSNLSISGNVLSDNGAQYSRSYYHPINGQIWTNLWVSNAVEATGSIDNNFFYAPAGTGGFEEMFNGCFYFCSSVSANFSEFSQANNLDVSGPDNASSNVWYAANGFSCTSQGANGWSYQASSDGSTWTNLSGCTTKATLDQEWTTGGSNSGFVSNFEELPPSTATSWVARSWTAPTSGPVSIRGRVLMTDPTCGSGIKAEITENASSTPIWGPQVIDAGDDVGVDTNLDGISVNAGDVLHFAVQENGSNQCRVSWTPSVAVPNPSPNPGSTVTVPSAGTKVTGLQTLEANAYDTVSDIDQVQFVLTGGSLTDAVIGTGTQSSSGWRAGWQSASVPDGTYSLQSVIRDEVGNVTYSPAVTITVSNPTTTDVVIPSDGATLSGAASTLDALSSPNVTSVSFELSGGGISDRLISASTRTIYGWIAQWNTTTVPDGTYSLQSVATNLLGTTVTSAPITITVENPAPTIDMALPSTGATLSGLQYLDATSSPGVASVEYELSGGTYNDAVISGSTLTYYGWIGSWNTTTVPNWTYTIQSVGTYADGVSGTSAPITITVNNT